MLFYIDIAFGNKMEESNQFGELFVLTEVLCNSWE